MKGELQILLITNQSFWFSLTNQLILYKDGIQKQNAHSFWASHPNQPAHSIHTKKWQMHTVTLCPHRMKADRQKVLLTWTHMTSGDTSMSSTTKKDVWYHDGRMNYYMIMRLYFAKLSRQRGCLWYVYDHVWKHSSMQHLVGISMSLKGCIFNRDHPQEIATSLGSWCHLDSVVI